MWVFICPVCKSSMERNEKNYICSNGHSFDLSKDGYINLMPSSKARGNAGDNAEMMAARTRFLNKGYYCCLKDELAKLSAKTVSSKSYEQPPLLVDAGCGEGYYTSGIAAYLKEKGINAYIAGFDISKRGVKAAAKRDKTVEFAVASIFEMPFPENSADIIFNIFAPVCEKEFHRVLKKDGILAIVSPGKDHLFGLKKVIYDNPYENDEKPFLFDGFEVADKIFVNREITVKGDEIGDLFHMTPYYWNTPAFASERLKTVDIINTPIEFIITVLKKQ